MITTQMVATRAQHPLVNRYLKDLERALRDVPGDRRRDIVEGIKAHIADAAADRGDDMTESELRGMLDEVGHPEAIAEEARDRFGISRRRGGAMEGIAIAALLVGGVVVPVLGWILGVILLWASSVWSVRDKILGTLVLPGGFVAPAYFAFFAVGVSRCVGGSCSGDDRVFFPPVAVLLLPLLVLAPVAVAIYLGRKAFRS